MSAGPIGWTFFLLCLVSTPIYMLVLVTLIKFRRKPPFDQHFFSISVSIGLFDMIHLLPGWATGRFANFGWLYAHRLVLLWPALWAKFESMCWWYAGLGQTFGTLLLAATRMLAVAYNYELTSLQLKAALLVHWLLPAVITAPQLWLDFGYLSLNDSSQGVMMFWVQPQYQNYYFTACIYWCAVLASLSALCFAVTIYTVYRSRKKVEQTAFEQSESKKLTEIKLAVVGFILFVLTAIYGVYCGLNSIVDTGPAGHGWRVVMMQLSFILGDVYSWINAYLLLICSRTVRERCKALLMGISPEKLILKSNQARATFYDPHDMKTMNRNQQTEKPVVIVNPIC